MAQLNIKKKNNGLYVGIAIAVVVVVAIIVGIVLATRGNNSGDSSGNGVSASDFENVDITIEYGDYEGMEKLAKMIQNGEATGKIVKIDGIVSHLAVSYSVTEANQDGTAKIGTQFVIDGAAEDDYPNDREHVVITGKIIEKEPLYYMIKTLPEYIEVK